MTDSRSKPSRRTPAKAGEPPHEPDTRRRAGVPTGLPVAAHAFVVLALIGLAIAPALLLQRASAAVETLTGTVVPTSDALRDLAFAMERRASSARAYFLTGDDAHLTRLAAAREAEDEALQELRVLIPRVSPAAVADLDVLETLAAERDSMQLELTEAGAGVEPYLAALPQFTLLQDSMIARVATLNTELQRFAQQQVATEARWARLHRSLAFVLGFVAVLAALLVAWFAWRQRRLTSEVQRALDQARRLRMLAERRREKLARVTESRTRLMRGFSHDVKNPLGAASGYLQLLEEGIMGPLTEKQLRSVNRAGHSIRAALALVEDLLGLARAESGALEVEIAPTDVGSVAREAADEYRAQAAAKGLALHVEAPENLPPVPTDGDPRPPGTGKPHLQRGQVHGGGRRHDPGRGRRQTAPPAAGTEELPIAVTDTGKGISPEQQKHLFEEFVRLDPSAEHGAGIGLTISRLIAQALDARITVDSEVGRGTTFTLWLPLGEGRAGYPAGAPVES
jgi:signal transduction histidine kinase